MLLSGGNCGFGGFWLADGRRSGKNPVVMGKKIVERKADLAVQGH